MDWQTYVALGIVVLAAVALVGGTVRKRRKGGCGGGCGCEVAVKKRPVGK